MSDARTVAVITDDEDTTASRVTAELAVRGVRVVMFDAADFPTRLRLAATIEADGRWCGTLMGQTSQGEPVEVDLDTVGAVYYRKPTQFQLAEGMSGPEQMWAYKEARRGFGGVLRALDCLWVNDPVQVAAAQYKPVQLKVAAQAGLTVPRTTITNDPDHAHRWAKRLCSPVRIQAAWRRLPYRHRAGPGRVHDPARRPRRGARSGSGSDRAHASRMGRKVP